jgi:excisionase family DNA binding protein
MERTDYSIPVPSALVDLLAERIAEIVIDRLGNELRPAPSGWMRTREAAAYLGITRGALYGRAHEIPHYRFERMLLFKRKDLDAWVEAHREEPLPAPVAGAPSVAPAARRQTVRRRRARPDTSPPGGWRERTRPTQASRASLPPPLGGDEAHKRQWAEQLEITREQLDEMSPADFKRAWEARNRRLEEACVFEHIEELAERFGWNEVHEVKPSILIEAAQELRTAHANHDPPSSDSA